MRTLVASVIVGLASCGPSAGQSPRETSAPGIAAGTLTFIGEMHAARAAHTSTALADGRVLIAGGMDGGLSTAEVFDPASRSFSPTIALRQERQGHAATRLPDGRVLLTGGWSGASTASSELFEPAAGRFVESAPMTTSRSGHVAVLLRTGKVLIAGGVSGAGDEWAFLASAELYDPATDRFTPTGAMSVPRESHTATLLPDGRVLITGGHAGRHAGITIYASAEIYDPASGRFTPTGAMGVRRHKHDAVALADGRVLIDGGADERDDLGTYRSTEIFDATTGTFTTGPQMSLARYKHNGTSILLPNGDVLIAGGAARPEIYTPATGETSVVSGAALTTGQFTASTLLASREVLVTGGYGQGHGARASAWLFAR